MDAGPVAPDAPGVSSFRVHGTSMTMIRRTITLLLCALTGVAAHAANWPEHPRLHAVRVAHGPKVDGDLSDPQWEKAPAFTDFTQHDPDDTRPATLPTSVRIVYDDHAIYFGLKMVDTDPPTARLARRDNFTQADFVSINLDPQLDRLSGNAFTVNPSNVQVDTVLYNDVGEDPSWDGVWDSATRIVADGWTAEVRIPFSQLRFPDKPVQVWGINITRRTTRTNEMVRIVNTPKGQTGFVSHFADIVGIEGIRRGRPLELLPYVVTRGDLRSRVDPADPLISSRETSADAGLDLKYALTSTLTLSGTLNPDFGQVEVDPAVVNLTEFETFYPEKRPFFTEGASLFSFGGSPAPSHINFIDPPSVFYSRRIGRSPQLPPDSPFADVPSQTRILGAAKVTGRVAGGWSLGVLDALTDTEHARFVTADGEIDRAVVEPMSNYFVSRVTKETAPGSRLGLIFTSVDRRQDGETSVLRNGAQSGGIDGYTTFGDRNWILEGFALGTRIEGSAESIALAQTAPVRYYQRPDASHVKYDPTRDSLEGWGGMAMLSRAKGVWRPIVSVQAYSPGFETNDVGFMQRTDLVSAHAVMQYVNETVTKRFRERNVRVGTWQNSNFDGDTLERGILAEVFGTLANYWQPRLESYFWQEAFSDRLTRGGPLAKVPGGAHVELGLESDDRKTFWFDLNGEIERSGDGSYVHSVDVDLSARPASNLQVSLEPSYSRSHEYAHYLTAFDDPAATATYGRRYLFAELEQHVFELATRVDWTLTSRLSFQLYVQPFIAAGDYHDPRALLAARTREYAPYAYNGAQPDFNLRSLRGSAVLRWEFRPGSALYVAWNENRAGFAPSGEFRLGHDISAIPDAPSHDVFIVKMSYWLPM